LPGRNGARRPPFTVTTSQSSTIPLCGTPSSASANFGNPATARRSWPFAPPSGPTARPRRGRAWFGRVGATPTLLSRATGGLSPSPLRASGPISPMTLQGQAPTTEPTSLPLPSAWFASSRVTATNGSTGSTFHTNATEEPQRPRAPRLGNHAPFCPLLPCGRLWRRRSPQKTRANEPSVTSGTGICGHLLLTPL
jgi:hypothetical protein